MDAPLLLRIFDGLYLLAMSSWIGSAAFFSFQLAPMMVPALRTSDATRFLKILLPRYYHWGVTSGVIALSSYICGVLTHPEDFRGPTAGVQAALLLSGILVMLYCGNELTPALNKLASYPGPEQDKRFERLHRRNTRLNALVLCLGIASMLAFVARPVPRSGGIVEPTPLERFEGNEAHSSDPVPSRWGRTVSETLAEVRIA